MNATDTTAQIPDTQDRELSGTRTTTEPTTGPATNTAQETTTAVPPTDLTTPGGALEGVRKTRKNGGSLTFAPDQTNLTPEQRAAFHSLGIDPSDPIAAAHARRFVHVCQLWNVDPWSGEIHLVQRGKIWDNGEDKRTWTIQTGIDGYRRRARNVSNDPASPVRWIGKAKWFWSYGDDDPQGRGYREVRDPDTGDLILTPAWYDTWDDRRGAPAMAKAVIITENKLTGERRVEQFVSNWKMFAVYEQVWEGRTKATNPDGTPKLKLGSFWEKGPAHMLAKTAEAQVLRATFHGYFHGVYTDEEMSRADTDAATEIEEAVARRRRDAFRKAQEEGEQVVRQVGASGPAADTIRAAALAAAQDATVTIVPGTIEPDTGPDAADPVPVGALVQQAIQPLDDAERRTLLLAEIDWISTELGVNMRNAIVKRAQKNLAEIPTDDLLMLVGPLRERMAIPHLRKTGRHADADAYASFGPHYIASMDVLLGHADPADDTSPDTTSTDGGTDTGADGGGEPADNTQITPPGPENDQDDPDHGDGIPDPGNPPHPFTEDLNDDSRCVRCGGFEDDPQHNTPPAATH